MTLPPITGVILAGGLAKRMGGQDKGLVNLGNKPLYLHAIEKIAPQVNYLLINANRNIAQYKNAGYPVITDSIRGFPGPLAGMLAGLENSETDWVLFIPCDTPYIPDNLLKHLWFNKNCRYAAYAHDEQREHPTVCLLNKNLIAPIKQFLFNGDRKLMLFLQQIHAQPVIFKRGARFFHNLNTIDDCQKLEADHG